MVGNRIKEVREKAGMTQEELAKAAGVCRTTISNLENNDERTTTTKTLFKIASALGTTIDTIFFADSV